MYIAPDMFSMIVGLLVISPLAFWLGYRFWLSGKIKNKYMILPVNQDEEAVDQLVEVLGISTKPDKQNRSFIPRGRRQATKIKEDPTKKDPVTGEPFTYDSGEVIKDKQGKVEQVGNTFDVYFPIGLPRMFTTKIRCMVTPAISSEGINFYGRQEHLKLTSHEVGLIHRESFTRNAIKASNDNAEYFEAMEKKFKPQKNTVIYLLVAIAIIGAVAAAYFGYMNYEAIQGLKWW